MFGASPGVGTADGWVALSSSGSAKKAWRAGIASVMSAMWLGQALRVRLDAASPVTSAEVRQCTIVASAMTARIDTAGQRTLHDWTQRRQSLGRRADRVATTSEHSNVSYQAVATRAKAFNGSRCDFGADACAQCFAFNVLPRNFIFRGCTCVDGERYVGAQGRCAAGVNNGYI